jgi:sigma-B regulation protein RsbU (phosphoserine phosphatase)
MKILIAEDDLVSRRLLEATLTRWGYETVVACDGPQAWQLLRQPEAPRLAILDWMMPGLDGVEVCRRVRGLSEEPPTYLILLTARHTTLDVVTGLYAGANDYITKPFQRDELRARVDVGVRVVRLQEALAARVRELGEALANIKQLQQLLPICSYCKKIRDDQNYWQQLETYLSEHAAARFTHGICPGCWEEVVKPQVQQRGQAAV